jgi:hypothetical protein
MKTSTNTTIKSKDNRKVSTIEKVANASVKSVTFEKALKSLEKALTSSENITRERAKALYAIKSKKMFDGYKDFKTFINEKYDGVIYGVKYNQANNLCNMYNYVWCDKDLSVYDSNIANNLVAYVKKDYAKVKSLHNKGIISPTMKKDEIIDVLKRQFGSDCKVTNKGTSEKVTSSANDDLLLAIAQVNHFIKKNAEKDGTIARSWQKILKALDV